MTPLLRRIFRRASPLDGPAPGASYGRTGHTAPTPGPVRHTGTTSGVPPAGLVPGLTPHLMYVIEVYDCPCHVIRDRHRRIVHRGRCGPHSDWDRWEKELHR